MEITGGQCAQDIAQAVNQRRVTAAAVIAATLERIARIDPHVNALVGVCAERARQRAARVDATIAVDGGAGALAGVPFVAKAQIAVAGLVTTAGSALHANDPPAARDADAVAALESMGAICVGVANMDEFGMGGTTENRLFGATRNPHDPTRTAGGSSGGSAAAVAAGLVPIALGSDALGSVRLPASLCGVYGLRPTRGAISGKGLLPPPGSVSTIGPFARSAADLAATFAALAGTTDALLDGAAFVLPRVGVPRGYFATNLDAAGAAAVARAAATFGRAEDVAFPEPARARAAAALVNAAESAEAQREHLRRDPDRFDPLTRDRFLAHALLPAGWYFRAQSFRRWHREQVLELLARYPLLLLPATPCTAPRLGTRTLEVDGKAQPTGPALGLFTQPLAALDCPILTVPIAVPGAMPIGVQLLAAPNQEPLLFRAAAFLERAGVAQAPVAAAYRNG